MRSHLWLRVVVLVLFALAATAPIARSQVAREAPPDPALDEGLAGLFAPGARLDAALSDRARVSGATVTAETLRLEEERAGIRLQGNASVPLETLRVALVSIGVPPGFLTAAIQREAWRHALAREVIRAERPRPTDAEIQAEFERRYGADGVARTYRHVLVTTDPSRSRLYAAADLARDLATLRSEARLAAGRAAARIASGTALEEVARESGGVVTTLADALARGGPGATVRAASTLEPGRPTVIEGDGAAFVLLLDRRASPARLEVVRAATLPRAGETAAATRERAHALAKALAAASDPALVSLRDSDDEDDRRTGGLLEATWGAPLEGGAAPDPRRLPRELIEAMGSLAPGDVSAPHPWRRGYIVARVLTRTPLSAQERLYGRAIEFPCHELEARRRLLAPRLASLAKAKAEELLRRVSAGETLALLSSESDDVATVDRGGLDPALPGPGTPFGDAVRGLPAGGGATILEGPDGFHVIRCEQERSVRVDQVAAELREALLRRPVPDAEVDRLLQDIRNGTR